MQIPKYVDLFQNFPSFGILRVDAGELARSHFGANAGLAVPELVVDTRLVGRLRGLPSRSHPITGTVVTSSSRSEALWLQRPSLPGGGLVLHSVRAGFTTDYYRSGEMSLYDSQWRISQR